MTLLPPRPQTTGLRTTLDRKYRPIELIVVRFSSGLGNQLFQFAAGRALSLRHGVPLVADPIAYCYSGRLPTRVTHRAFVLGGLGLPISVRQARADGWRRFRGFRRLRGLVLDTGRARYECTGLKRPEFDSLPAECVISGYFQDQRYFAGARERVCAEVASALPVVADGSVDSEGCRVGAIHMRFGDYLQHPEFNPTRMIGYYGRSIEWLLDELRCDLVNVFSDEPERAKALTGRYGAALRILPPDPELGGARDMARMASASAIAIANSSFSWWAAALASARGARIAAPGTWSSWCSDPGSCLYGEQWHRIEVP